VIFLHAIPASQERRTFPDAGGLMSYGASRMDGMRFAGWISRARAIHFRRACYGRGRSCRRDNRAHNRLVGGSSPSSPTMQSDANRNLPVSDAAAIPATVITVATGSANVNSVASLPYPGHPPERGL
jgi:hypothetical protein